MPLRVACVVEIPTPYRQPVFDLLSKRQEIDFHLFYLSDSQKDRHWEVEKRNYATYLKSWQLCFPGYHTIHWNWSLGKLLQEPYDVYVIGGYAQPALKRLLAHCWDKKIPYVILTESHLGKKRNRWFQWLKRSYVTKVYEKSRANLVMGAASAAYVQHFGGSSQHVFHFPNSIDGPSFGTRVEKQKVNREQLKKHFGISTSQVLLFIGALNHRKGVDQLLSVFFTLSKDHPELSLLLVGEGGLKEKLMEEVKHQGLEKKVIFTGFIQPIELPKVLACADLFVLPSLEEPFGAVICEAMAAGLPIIASEAVGAVPDFVKPEENGIVIQTGSRDSLEKGLRTLLSDPDRMRRMGLKSRERMEQWTDRYLSDQFIAAVRSANPKLDN